MTNNVKLFIGSGIMFPIHLQNGKVPIYNDLSLIRSSIAIILNWQLGTRHFNEPFGSRIFETLEEPNANVTRSLISFFLIEALTKWEKRILIKSNSVKIEKVTHDKLNITLTYKLRNSNIEDTYIYPYYKQIIY